MTGNPTLNENTFNEAGRVLVPGDAMTVQGTVNKTSILLILTTLAASYTWHLFWQGNVGAANVWLMGGAIGGFIVSMITIFKKNWSPVTAPIYAVLEGLFIGGLSCLFERQLPGIVIQAVMLTFGTLAALLAAYTAGLIRASAGFRNGVIAATGGIALVYLVSMVLGFFHIQIPGIFGNGIVGIGFSLVVVIIAAMNLVLDFDMIESGAAAGAPKYFEWYAGFSLLVTLVWLYLEILRLLSKLRSRD
jgi:uncharacterized YccA/Bax inhibitor family protein